jgi:hypothetical protein
MKTQEGSVRLGVAVAAIGGVLALLVYAQPEKLRAPAWVVYAVALALVLAGWTVVARASGHHLLKVWLPVPLLACLVSPALWLGFGGGRRQCTVSIGYGVLRMFGTRPDLACRIAFGIAAVIGVALVIWAIRVALRASREPGS